MRYWCSSPAGLRDTPFLGSAYRFFRYWGPNGDRRRCLFGGGLGRRRFRGLYRRRRAFFHDRARRFAGAFTAAAGGAFGFAMLFAATGFAALTAATGCFSFAAIFGFTAFAAALAAIGARTVLAPAAPLPAFGFAALTGATGRFSLGRFFTGAFLAALPVTAGRFPLAAIFGFTGFAALTVTAFRAGLGAPLACLRLCSLNGRNRALFFRTVFHRCLLWRPLTVAAARTALAFGAPFAAAGFAALVVTTFRASLEAPLAAFGFAELDRRQPGAFPSQGFFVPLLCRLFHRVSLCLYP